MLDFLFLFLCACIFMLCILREKDKSLSNNNLRPEISQQLEPQEVKLCTNIKHLQEEQNVLIQHLKEALVFSDQMQVAHLLAEKKVARLEKELYDKKIENKSFVEELEKKECLLLCVLQQKQYYKEEINRLTVGKDVLQQQTELLQKEIIDCKRIIDMTRDQLQQHACENETTSKQKFNSLTEIHMNEKEKDNADNDNDEVFPIVTRL